MTDASDLLFVKKKKRRKKKKKKFNFQEKRKRLIKGD